MGSRKSAGHLAALFTIIIWGTTFISTKVLLADFKPVEILFFRFVMGFAALLLVCPHRMKGVNRKQEMTFVLAGLCGICLYYLLENIALTYTMASNVGVIISVAPFFTAMLSRLFLKSEGKLRANFFIGFVVAMAGVALISFNGSRMELNPAGDVLAVLAAFVWACYSILTRKISSFGYLRVDYDDDDALIESMVRASEKICMDIIRTDDRDVLERDENAKTAVLYAAAYLYEHREDADHHAMMLTLRALLSGSRKEAF